MFCCDTYVVRCALEAHIKMCRCSCECCFCLFLTKTGVGQQNLMKLPGLTSMSICSIVPGLLHVDRWLHMTEITVAIWQLFVMNTPKVTSCNNRLARHNVFIQYLYWVLTEMICIHTVSVLNADWSDIYLYSIYWMLTRSDIFSCSICSEYWLKWYKKKVCSIPGDGIPVKDFVNHFSPVVPVYKFEGSSEWVGQGS